MGVAASLSELSEWTLLAGSKFCVINTIAPP